ncbi:MAG: 16S rRNA (uracil(1498)-N(3))-methyltransferase [Campylobacterota bacterium]|nr:16S rRNA (uracil(1498)-N(3))-methyltransferase [Campylobacterota bacterium]
MQFTFHENASNDTIEIEAELHKYLFKVRRHSTSDDIFFRNLEDKNIYRYKVQNINRRKTTLVLEDFEEKIIEPKKELHIGWCVIDPKSVEKYIASLNELGVTKITFIYCEYSQKQYKQNIEKLQKILINSSGQCGRSSIIKLEVCDSLDKFINQYPNSYMFNFSDNNITDKKEDIETIIIGCEGGFSSFEVDSFNHDKIVGIDSNMILRSETAVVSVASKILT